MSSSRFGLLKHAHVAVALAAIGAFAAAMPATAGARSAYVANSGDGTVSVLNTATNGLAGTISVGGEPVSVAITPDGTKAYVADDGPIAGSVLVIDTTTNTVVGSPISGIVKPGGIAITPDGTRAYVTDAKSGTVVVIDTATNAISGTPIKVGEKPEGIAISPDGTRAFVAQRGGDVSIIDTATGAVVGVVKDPLSPSQVAIGPHGGRVFVTNSSSNSVTAFNPANGAVVGSIMVGKEPRGIAIGPDGSFAYAASPVDGTVTLIDTSLDSPLPAPIPFPGATAVAIRPDGNEGFVTNGAANFVSVLDTRRNAAAGTIGVGAKPVDVAVVPDQAPRASFWVSPTMRRAKANLTFHAGGSSDPDGTIANYAWTFGDGSHAEGESPTRIHRYRRPGTYEVTLVTTDAEGCSTQQVYTGRTASCNGGSSASVTVPLTVLPRTGPVVRLAGAKRQPLRGKVKLFAMCPREACSISARGALFTTIESGGALHQRRFTLGSALVSLQAGRWGRAFVPVRPGTRRAVAGILRRGGRAQARLTVIASNSGGEQRIARRTVELRVP